MFARVVLTFHPAHLSTCEPDSLSPIIPTVARPSHNSNHSRTYEIPRGGGYTGFLVRPIRCASKPFVSPTCKITVRNSLISPTYAKIGECIPLKLSARRHFRAFPAPTFVQPSPNSNHSGTYKTPQGRNAAGPTNRRERGGPFLHLINLLYFLYLLLLHLPPIHNPVTPPSPIFLPLLSQSSPVRGPTLTPCLSLSECLRYTSTDAIRPARSAHETRTDH
jgi:hypothetical protein